MLIELEDLRKEKNELTDKHEKVYEKVIAQSNEEQIKSLKRYTAQLEDEKKIYEMKIENYGQIIKSISRH